MARRTKLTPRVRQEIADYIRLGMTLKDAALGAGIAESTLYLWLQKGREANKGMYHAFYLEVERAKLDLKQRALRCLYADAATNPKTAMWILERRHPEDWGKKIILNIPELTEENIQRLSDETLEELARVTGVSQRLIREG